MLGEEVGINTVTPDTMKIEAVVNGGLRSGHLSNDGQFFARCGTRVPHGTSSQDLSDVKLAELIAGDLRAKNRIFRIDNSGDPIRIATSVRIQTFLVACRVNQ